MPSIQKSLRAPLMTKGAWVAVALVFGSSGLAFSQAASPPAAAAVDPVGTIKIVGSGPSMNVIIRATDDNEISVCPGDVAKGLRRISGMKVKLVGKPSVRKRTQVPCFQVDKFEILETSSGRPAIVGTLRRRPGTQLGFFVQTTSGEERSFSVIPKSMENLVGRRVVVDAKLAAGTDAAGGENWRIVTYGLFPGE